MMIRISVLFTFGLIALVSGQIAQACVVLPVPQESASSALDRASDVGMVQVESIEREVDGFKIRFKLLEVFKGNGGSLETVFFPCPRCAAEVLKVHPVDQNVVEFFSGAQTSMKAASDCSVFTRVVVGEKYLFVRTNPISRFLLEKVSEGDRWLYTAKKYLSSREFQPLEASEYIQGAKYTEMVSCDHLQTHYLCVEGIKYILMVRRHSSSRMLYPSEDGRCFFMQEEFRVQYGFELGGLDEGGSFCPTVIPPINGVAQKWNILIMEQQEFPHAQITL